MENKIGVIEDEIKFVKKDESLARRIIKAREWNADEETLTKVFDMLRYNMFTVGQFSSLSGLENPTIEYHLRKRFDKDGKVVCNLDCCFPFKNMKSKGPKFIYRNERALKIIGV